MAPHEKRVKDKHIIKDDVGFVAVVEYYQDTPERDSDVQLEKTFKTMTASQKWLIGFPRDVWDGFASNEYSYREPDEGKINVRTPITRKTRKHRQAIYKEHRANWLGGRTLVERGARPL